MNLEQKEIIGMRSAVDAAERNAGKNIAISASLVLEMYERIKELEEALEDARYEVMEAAEMCHDN